MPDLARLLKPAVLIRIVLTYLGLMALFATMTRTQDDGWDNWLKVTLGLTALMLVATGGIVLALSVAGGGGLLGWRAGRARAAGNPAAALAGYNAALTRNPNLAEALVGRAELQIAGGQPAPARADLDRAIAVTPHVSNFPDPILYRAYLERGRLREAAGDGAGAISDWTQTMRITAGAPDPYLLRGRALLEAGDWLTGRSDLTQAVSLLGLSLNRTEDKAAQAALLNMRGLAFNLLNDPQRALADLEQSLTIQPAAWVTHYNLGATYLKLGHPDQALIALRQALQLDRPAAQAAARSSRAYADLREEPAFQALIGA